MQDQSRRNYWTEQMQLGYAFVERMLQFEVQESRERFAGLREAAADAKIEMRFSESTIAADMPRVFSMRESLVQDIVEIGRAMNRRGWVLQIEDGYRSLEMQRQLVRKPALFDVILERCCWENAGVLPSLEVVFRRATVLLANIPKIGTHMSGSAIDVSVYDRDDGFEIWRGDSYLTMSERTPMRSPFVEAEAMARRQEIADIMEAHGFLHYPFEFWHFSKGDAMAHLLSHVATPARYGPVEWDPRTNDVVPIERSLAPLIPLPVLEQEIAAAIKRGALRKDHRHPSLV
jgi:zinc D-Ala-D-Ala dipeptidase